MESGSNGEPPWYGNRQRSTKIDGSAVRAFLSRVGREVAGGREFAVVVSSDAAVRRANRRFRGKRGATDVLSFPDGENGRLGDILISAQCAARQAEEHGHPVEEEIKILVLHGLLHLLGYDHERDNGEMQRAETRWRGKLGLGAALIERAAS
jgi:probable rRNA maturation factor